MRLVELFNTDLLELFDNGSLPVKWKYQDDTTWYGEFNFNRSIFTFSAAHIGNNAWEIEFRDRMEVDTRDQFGKTSKHRSKSFTVFSTVLSMIGEFIKSQKPDTVSFTGSVKSGQGDLYKSMLKHEAPKLKGLGYEVTASDGRDEINFVLTKTH